LRIALAQTRPVRGDIERNLAAHLGWIERAAGQGAALVAFSELSLTGYEPRLAEELALDEEDERLRAVQRLVEARGIVAVLGAPTRAAGKPRISLLIFRPLSLVQVYSKQHLHADEEPFFQSGTSANRILEGQPKIALAICYELSVPAHAEAAFRGGAGLYLASVAKTARGVEQSSERLASLARRHRAPVLMVNCVGLSGDGECAGASSAWNSGGELLERLSSDREGLLLFDEPSQKARTLVDGSIAKPS
jgi:predicted amidohydrolase